MKKLVIVRSAESIWTKDNRFTGWTDIGLSDEGVINARKVGKILNEKGFTFDSTYTSYLKRAIRTSWIILDEMDLMWIPVTRTWRLNARHYGALQGEKKSDCIAKYGDKQVLEWRRTYEAKPPALEKDDPRYPGNDIRYKDLNPINLPKGESLKDALNRVLPVWQQNIIPELRKDKKVLLVAHGNVIRALLKELGKLPEKEVASIEVPLAKPLVYEFDDNLKPIKYYYLE